MTQLYMMDERVPSSDIPFRYTGGKRKIQTLVEMKMPQDAKEMLSPFMGGCALELKIASSGKRVYAHDMSQYLTDFWLAFLDNPEAVCNNAYHFYSGLNKCEDKDKIKRIVNSLSVKREVLNIKNKYTKAGVLWVLNGMVKDGKPGAYFCSNRTENGANRGQYWGIRRPEFYIQDKYLNWKNEYFSVDRLDWRVSMEKYPTMFMYADPPYIDKDMLYDGANEPFQHDEFAEVIKSRDSKWILSYGDHPKIVETYSEYEMLRPTWTKQSSNPIHTKERKKAEELLILNL